MFKDYIELGKNKIKFDMTERFVDSKDILNISKEYNKIVKTKKDNTKDKYQELNKMLYKFINYFLSDEEYNELIQGYNNSFMYNSMIVKELFNAINSQNVHLKEMTAYFTNFNENEDTKENK